MRSHHGNRLPQEEGRLRPEEGRLRREEDRLRPEAPGQPGQLRKSTGPADTERTKYNAVRHGLCAESLTLPGEDPEVARQLVDDWDSYYRPRGPAERHLADECIRASLLAGRAHDASMTALTKQVREADEDWLRHDEEKLAHLRKMLEDDPAAALREMRRSASGCRWMIGRWEELGTALEVKGNWCEVDRNEAIRLTGHRPELEMIRLRPDAWYPRMLNLICNPMPNVTTFNLLFDVEHLPERYRLAYEQYRFPPTAEEARPILQAMVAAQLPPLREREEFLRIHIEAPDRAEAPRRARVLKDEKDARLFLRYQSEARSTFHRAYAALVKAIDRRQEEDDGSDQGGCPDGASPAAESSLNPIVEGTSDESVGADPVLSVDPVAEPVSGVPTASEAVSRNEANSAVESSQVIQETTVPASSGGAVGAARGGRKGSGDGARRVEALLGADLTADPGGEIVPIAILGAGS